MFPFTRVPFWVTLFLTHSPMTGRGFVSTGRHERLLPRHAEDRRGGVDRRSPHGCGLKKWYPKWLVLVNGNLD